MSMLDSFFKQRFNAAKCKTLLKLTIPRIKLLRNRREAQLKQMRKEIAKLLETGQEATARIRVEHIIREEKMMAAQEIVELFCELISVRLPIIEAQRECPLDLKEAISSVCFAAPRCADLPELIQAQLLFAGKYGREFVIAATELMPECGVNRQLIELLSIRAPAPEVKLNLLKEIAEEHQLDWDPSSTENELLKPHEDLLNGPTQFVSGSKLPLPKEKLDETTYTAPEPATHFQNGPTQFVSGSKLPLPKEKLDETTYTAPEPATHFQNGPTQFVSGSKLPLPKEKLDETTYTAPEPATHEKSDSDSDFDIVDFPEVPTQPLHPNKAPVSTPVMLHFPESALSDVDDQEEPNPSASEDVSREKSVAKEDIKQFVPFISPPSQPSETVAAITRQSNSPPAISQMREDYNIDLQDVLAAARAAADSAERAAAAARSAASIAQLRISELVKKRSNEFSVPNVTGSDKQTSNGDSGSASTSPPSQIDGCESNAGHQLTPASSFNSSSPPDNAHHQPQRLPSMDDESYFSYPNLFTSQGSNVGAHPQSPRESK